MEIGTLILGGIGMTALAAEAMGRADTPKDQNNPPVDPGVGKGREQFKLGLKIGAAMAVGAPIVLMGIVLVLTIALWPVGVAMMYFGARLPQKYLIQLGELQARAEMQQQQDAVRRKNEEVLNNADNLEEGEAPPWMV